MVKKDSSPAALPSAPASTGNAGASFEAKVGAFYLLSLIGSAEPRGLPGAVAQKVLFQQGSAGRPLDDFTIEARNADASEAFLEIQAKRSLDFTASDEEFRDVVRRMWQAAQKPEFAATRYEVGVAISRSTTRIERACQEVLHWARHVTDAKTLIEHINRPGFASKPMRDFVEVFRKNLAAAGAPADDETVWRLLSRFQILVFDFEAPGSDYEHRARERARAVLVPDQAARSTELWPVLGDIAENYARAGGSADAGVLKTKLKEVHGFLFEARIDLKNAHARLKQASIEALGDITDNVGGIRLSRSDKVEEACAALEASTLVEIVGRPGVGKSAVLKHLAERAAAEGTTIVLGPGRIEGGGWLKLSHLIGAQASKEEFFNEIGCGGAAVVFVDNIDQIEDEAEWATAIDLLRGIAANPGWRAVVTAGTGTAEWKTKLPEELRKKGIATVTVEELSNVEAAQLAAANQALGFLLSSAHPARAMARNLFHLSRLFDLRDEKEVGSIASETDLARAWWRFGGGKVSAGRLARLKILRQLGAATVALPGRMTFRVDTFEAGIITELLGADSLREVREGSTIAFRHDVLRDWTLGFLFDEGEVQIPALATDRTVPASIARGLEIAARLTLDGDSKGAKWLALMSAFEGAHGSWRRPIVLALARSERSFEHLQGLKAELLGDKGRRLSELLRLVMAVEVEPFAAVSARYKPGVPVPSGAETIMVPKGSSWSWLVLWLVSNKEELPSAVIPDVSKFLQMWLTIAQNEQSWRAVNGAIIEIVGGWLIRVEDAIRPGVWRKADERQAIQLDFAHERDVRDELRTTMFAFCHLNPPVAEQYIRQLDPKMVRHHDAEFILRVSGGLATAAPKAYVEFALRLLIPDQDEDDVSDHRHALGPFDLLDYNFSPASPAQGPFLGLLEADREEGLRLIRGVVEHGTDWLRRQYATESVTFPTLTIPFPDGARSFQGDFSVYHWPRGGPPSEFQASALMALEAWAHRDVERGRPFEDVLHDVLGPDGSSVAFVSVAVDLVLSHWDKARSSAWPLVGTPELMVYDDARHNRDVTGVDRYATGKREPAGTVQRADLDRRPSRRVRLTDALGNLVHHGRKEELDVVRAALVQACERIEKINRADDDDLHGLRATARRALRMSDPANWVPKTVQQADGSAVDALEFQLEPEERRRSEEGRARSELDLVQLNIRFRLQKVLLGEAPSTPEFVTEGIDWAKSEEQQTPKEESEDRDFGAKWNERAVVMAAAIAARDYAADDRQAVLGWALPVLDRASREGEDFTGNAQVQYSRAGIATIGLIGHLRKEGSEAARDQLLSLAGNDHEAVVAAVAGHLKELEQVDGRLPRSIVRIVMASAIHTRHRFREGAKEAAEKDRADRIATAIAAERSWLKRSDAEPPWPGLPHWVTRKRKGIRLGPNPETAGRKQEKPRVPDTYADEGRLGSLVQYLIPLGAAGTREWVKRLAVHFMGWTADANGPVDDDPHDRDNRPTTWNLQFFDFLGVISVALPQDEVAEEFLRPMGHFTDEAFCDAAAAFLRGFDRATIATDTPTPENPGKMRALLAERLQKTRSFRRCAREKSFMAETHLGDAFHAMCYQPARWASAGRAHIPTDWPGLVDGMPVIAGLVRAAPSSGYLATLVLNLLENQARPELLPFVVDCLMAWREAYDADPNFWVEKEIGSRACTWLRTTLERAKASTSYESKVLEDLHLCLDLLVRVGVGHASDVERILQGPPFEKTS